MTALQSDRAKPVHTEICRLLIAERKTVGTMFGFALVANANWDMFLDLYLAENEDRSVYLWQLCVAANIPISTAHRKIMDLVGAGFLVRAASDGDRRRIGVALSPRSRAIMDALMDRLAARFGR